MLTTVDKSPCEIPMLIAAVEDALLSDRLQRLGVGIGDEIKRLEEDAMISPVRVRGPKGEVLLAAGMASKII
ncbi:MAG: ferrous iron transport protein A, partial [Deltaproteobacteria bacterium]|nr:ferrous iron transport protein A [Deltaproteobacteria bacterium]